MDSDNLYPNKGEYFTASEPAEQKLARNREKSQARSSKPVLRKLVKHFDERIAFYSSVDSIPVNVDADPSLHQKVVAINRGMKAELVTEKEWIESLLDE